MTYHRPPLYRKCINSSLKLWKKTSKRKQGKKISKKITVRGKKSRSGMNIYPCCGHVKKRPFDTFPKDSLFCYLSILRGVHPEPPVGLPEVVEDDPGAVVWAGGQHDAGGAVCLAGHPGAVEGVGDQQESDQANETVRDPLAVRRGGTVLPALAALGGGLGGGGGGVQVPHVGWQRTRHSDTWYTRH